MSTAMRFDGELAEIRFGCGLSPNHVLATSPEDVLSQLAAPDLAAPRASITFAHEYLRIVAANVRVWISQTLARRSCARQATGPGGPLRQLRFLPLAVSADRYGKIPRSS